MAKEKISFRDDDKSTANRRRRKRKKKSKVAIIILSVILLIIASLIISIILFIKGRLDKLNVVDLDKNDLDINSNIYDELGGSISKSEFDDIVTIALFGSDSRNTENIHSGRADSIIIASINPKLKSIKLLSIPRDTYVNIPGYGWDKINHAFSYGGEQLLIKTINSNFGLAITEFASIDFLGLANVINAVGGIEMNISKAEMDIINQYLKEIYALENKPYVAMTQYGKVTLSGEQAVAHCRDRYVGSDFDRATRQRDVITAVLNKISIMSVDKSLDILDIGLSQITTSVKDITPYLGKITSMLTNINEYKNNIISVQIPSTEYGSDKYINGVYYFSCDMNKAKQDFLKYIYEK